MLSSVAISRLPSLGIGRTPTGNRSPKQNLGELMSIKHYTNLALYRACLYSPDINTLLGRDSRFLYAEISQCTCNLICNRGVA